MAYSSDYFKKKCLDDDDIGSCSICVIPYDEERIPKLLSCGHTFCLPCTLLLSKGQTRITCPLCQHKTDTTFAPLRTNYELTDVLAKLAEIRTKSMKNEVACQECHTKIALQKVRYCKTCVASSSDRICLECCVENHNGHELVTLAKIIEMEVGELKNSVKEHKYALLSLQGKIEQQHGEIAKLLEKIQSFVRRDEYSLKAALTIEDLINRGTKIDQYISGEQKSSEYKLFSLTEATLNGIIVLNEQILALESIAVNKVYGTVVNEQSYSGDMYPKEWDVKKSYSDAVIWFTKAAERGDPYGQNHLGFLYQNGWGVEKSYEEAVKWYRRAAEQGNADGQKNLGWMYRNGLGVNISYEEAAKWFRKAAEQGHPDGQNNLGWMYQNGWGVEKSYEEAVKWYSSAAEQGNAEGQNNLGAIYMNGWGVEKSYEKALKWYRRAAERGHAKGQNNLGVMYTNGWGVEKSYEAALKWYRKAVEQGLAWGQKNLGDMYQNGWGVEKSNEEAVKWYRKAAEQGNESATSCLQAMGLG